RGQMPGRVVFCRSVCGSRLVRTRSDQTFNSVQERAWPARRQGAAAPSRGRRPRYPKTDGSRYVHPSVEITGKGTLSVAVDEGGLGTGGRRSATSGRARLNLISHLLHHIPYKDIPVEKVKLPERQKPRGYKERLSLQGGARAFLAALIKRLKRLKPL